MTSATKMLCSVYPSLQTQAVRNLNTFYRKSVMKTVLRLIFAMLMSFLMVTAAHAGSVSYNCAGATPKSGTYTAKHSIYSLYGNSREGYSYTSDVAVALVHSGLAKAGETVFVYVEALDSVRNVRGEMANGISSGSIGNNTCAFRLAIAPIVNRTEWASCSLPSQYTQYPPRQFVGKLSGTVVGDNEYGYSTSSDPDAAVVHAGLLRPGETKPIYVFSVGRWADYLGSTRNGVTSLSSRNLECSVRFSLTPEDLAPSPHTVQQCIASLPANGRYTAGWAPDYLFGDNTNGYAITDAYPPIASALQHAGLLMAGDTAEVRFISAGKQYEFVGSTANQVTSKSWRNVQAPVCSMKLEVINPPTRPAEVISADCIAQTPRGFYKSNTYNTSADRVVGNNVTGYHVGSELGAAAEHAGYFSDGEIVVIPLGTQSDFKGGVGRNGVSKDYAGSGCGMRLLQGGYTNAEPVITFQRSPENPTAGQPYTLTWSTSRATNLVRRCVTEGAPGDISDEVLPISGSSRPIAEWSWVGKARICKWMAAGNGGAKIEQEEPFYTQSGYMPAPTLSVQRTPSPTVAGQAYQVKWTSANANYIQRSCDALPGGFIGSQTMPDFAGTENGIANAAWVGKPSTCTWTAVGYGGTARHVETMTTYLPGQDECDLVTPPSKTYTAAMSAASVWGNNSTGYSVDSVMEMALVHSGLVPAGASANVTVTKLGQLSTFGGTTANGVSTYSSTQAKCGMRLSLGGPVVLPSNAGFVSQYLPAKITTGERYAVTITLANTGMSTWSKGTFKLVPQNPANNKNWIAESGIDLIQDVAPGQTYVATFYVRAPALPGTYNFQWRMADAAGVPFGASSTNVVVNVIQTVAIPVVSMTSPTDGAIVTLSGTTTAVAFAGTASPGVGRTISKIEVLEGENVLATASGNTLALNVVLSNGPHMVRLRATDNEGATGLSAEALVRVGSNNAEFAEQAVPATMVAGQRYSVSVTMRNTGTTTWQPSTTSSQKAYALSADNPPDNTVWRSPSRVPLASAVEPGSSATFTFEVTAPATPGNYNFQWKMAEVGGNAFGAASPVVTVAVAASVAPTATLSATPRNARVHAGESASIALQGRGSQPASQVVKLEAFLDSGAGYGTQAVASTEGAAATLALDRTVALPHGSHRLMLRATDAHGRTGDSAPVIVTVNDSRLAGAVTGMRVVANRAHLAAWVMVTPGSTALAYKVYVKAPRAFGGVEIASGTVTAPTATGATAQQPVRREIDVDVEARTVEYPGEAVYVEVVPPTGGAPVVLPDENGSTIMPGTLRIGLTSPTASNEDRFKSPNPAFLRAVVTGHTGEIGEVQFNVDGSWIAATAEGNGAYSVQKTGLAARAAPYSAFARVQMGQGMLMTEERRFYMDVETAITLRSPQQNQKLILGKPFRLSAQPVGNVVGLHSVTFHVNGKLIGLGANDSGVWTYRWTPPAVGAYTIQALAADANGVRISHSPVVTITVMAESETAALEPIAEAPPHLNNPDAGTLPGGLDVGNDGAAIYSIPIVVPPGTAGMQPSLSLNYSSNGRNGLLGLGWSLKGLSSIQRCAKTVAQDGVVGRVNFDKSDRLCIDGQRLVRIKGAAASSVEDDDEKYWSPSAEFRTELNSFSRVTRVLEGTAFKVEPTNGLVFYYGSGTSAIAAQGRSDQAVLAWEVGRVQDRSGNYMEVDYSLDAERGEHTVRQIRYGGYQQNGANADPAKSLATDLAVRFEYEERSDAQLQYIAGSRHDLRKRLAHLRTYIDTAADGSGGTLVRDYELHYETSPSSGRSVIDWVQVCARDASSGVCQALPKTSFNWGKDVGVTMRIASVAPRVFPATQIRSALSYLADIDGSGTTSYLIPWSGPEVDASCTGGSVCLETTLDNKIDGYTASDQPFHVELLGYKDKGTFTEMATGDLDGDGREDLIYMDPVHGKWIYCLSLSTATVRQFAECQVGGAFSSALTDTSYQVPLVVDLKRDGRVHVLTPFDGAGNAKDCHLQSGGIVCSDVSMTNLTPGAGGAFPFDKLQAIGLNSDGLTDLYAVWDLVGQPRVTICSNSGDHFNCKTQEVPESGRYGPTAVSSDFNNDGLTDFLLVGYLCLSTGGAAQCAPAPNGEVTLASNQVLTEGVKDWLGDGFGHFYGGEFYSGKDAGKGKLCHMENGGWSCSPIQVEPGSEGALAEIKGMEVSSREFYAQPNGKPGSLVCRNDHTTLPKKCWLVTLTSSAHLDRITSVVNGLGNRTELEYARADDASVYSRLPTIDGAARKPSYPQLSIDPGTLVKHVRRDTGLGHLYTTSYHYGGALQDAYRRVPLGFGLVRISNAQTAITTENVLRQDFPFVGMVQRRQANSTSCTLSDTSYKLDQKMPVTLGSTSIHFPYIERISTTTKDLDCSPLGNVQTDYHYDDSGNVKSHTVTATGGGETFTTVANTEYVSAAQEDAHLLALPKKVQLTRTAPDTASITRTIAYEYDAGTGLPISETIEPGNPRLQVSTSFNRGDNGYGLVNSITRKWEDPACPVSKSGCGLKSRLLAKMIYRANGRFPWKMENALGHTETHVFDPASGETTSIANSNGLTTAWTLDGFGNIKSETRADGNSTKRYYKQCSATLCPQKTDASLLFIADQFHGNDRIATPTMVYADNSGRPLRSQSRSFDGGWAYVERVYDAMGRLDWMGQQVDYSVSTPAITGRLLYDELNRVTKLIKLDDTDAEIEYITSYSGYTRVATSPLKLANGLAQSRTERRDVIGQLREVTDSAGAKISYEYDAFGNLRKTTDPSGNEIVVSYDELGRRTRLKDPDLGEIKYELDPLGQVLAQISPEQAKAAQKTTFEYDALGRLIARYEPDLESHWVYDSGANAIGKLAEAYTGNSETKDYRRLHKYDALGRLAETKQFVGGKEYSTASSFDLWNRLAKQTHQRGGDPATDKAYELRYNSMGYLAYLVRDGIPLWQVVAQDAANRLRKVALGNGLTQTNEYFTGSGRLASSVLVASGQIRRLEEGYLYDKIGNVKERTQYWDNEANEGFTEYFNYDGQNRLESSKIDSELQSYTYFADGRIKSKTGVGTGDYVYPQPGPGTIQPHAVRRIPGLQGEFSYDLNGNRIAGNGYELGWTSFDMPKTIKRNGNSSSFNYGAEHQRIVQTRGDGTTITYVGAQEVETVSVDGKSTSKVKTYWPLGIGVEIEQEAQTRLYWTHTDRLGSVVAISKLDGTLEEKLAYDAWGKRRMLTSQAAPDTLNGQLDNAGYTGHEMLDQLDLVHMNGRVYDPLVAQFLSGDPLIDDPTNSQNFSRYSYVLNNPTNLIDPTGFSSESPTQQVVIAGQKDSKTDSGSQMYSDYGSFTATLDVFPYTGPGSLVAVLTSSRKKPGVQMGSPHKVFRFRSANNGQQAMTLPMAAVGGGLIVSTMCMATSGCAEWVREQLKTLSDPFFNSGNGDRAPSLSRDFPGTNSASSGAPGDPDDGDEEKKGKSPNQLNKEIKQGKAPKDVERVDIGKVKGEQTHTHFKDGSALNKDGTWKHGESTLSRSTQKWLIDNGWKLPK